MHKPESVIENIMHKILWDFVIQTDHSIPTRKQDFELINKKKELVIWWILLFQSTTEWKWKKDDQQILRFYQKMK